jgi:hypothetical protein
MVKSITIKRLNMKNAYNKLLKRDKLQLASSAPLHILANYNLPLNRALYILGESWRIYHKIIKLMS